MNSAAKILFRSAFNPRRSLQSLGVRPATPLFTRGYVADLGSDEQKLRKIELEVAAAQKRRGQLVPYADWQLKIGRTLASFFRLKEKGAANNWFARAVYSNCTIPASENRDFFFGACLLPDTFQTWFCITQLHIWLAVVRLRAEGDTGRDVARMIVEYFVNEVEIKISGKGVRTSEAMKEFMAQYHGLSLAYDEGIYSDDTVLAAALWRNMTQLQGDPHSVALLVQYVRAQAQLLDTVSSEAFMKGEFMWRAPEFNLPEAAAQTTNPIPQQ